MVQPLVGPEIQMLAPILDYFHMYHFIFRNYSRKHLVL